MKTLELCHKTRRLSPWATAIGSVALFCTACHPGPALIKTSAVSVDGTIAGLVHTTSNSTALTSRKITAVNVNTGARYDTTTGANGGYSLKVPEGSYRLEVEVRDGERLARQPGQTRVNRGDLDPGRDFEVTVTATAHP